MTLLNYSSLLMNLMQLKHYTEEQQVQKEKELYFFLTDNADVAASYIKNGGKVMKYEVSNYALFNLRQRGILNTLEDIHKIGGKEIRHFTYKFEGSNVRQALNQIAKPN